MKTNTHRAEKKTRNKAVTVQNKVIRPKMQIEDKQTKHIET